MKFSEKIKAVRYKLFLTQQEIAKELNVAFATVNRWENEKMLPSLKAQKVFHEFCVKNGIKFDD